MITTVPFELLRSASQCDGIKSCTGLRFIPCLPLICPCNIFILGYGSTYFNEASLMKRVLREAKRLPSGAAVSRLSSFYSLRHRRFNILRQSTKVIFFNSMFPSKHSLKKLCTSVTLILFCIVLHETIFCISI